MDMTPADYAALNGNDGMFGGNGLWFLALLFLFGNGGFGGRNQAATTDELGAGFNFAGVNNKLNEITAGIAGVNQNLSNAICSSTYELASKIDACCCSTKEAIGQVRYDMAVQNAATAAAIHAEGEATRAMLQQNKIESLQAQVSQLQLAQATCGIPKINQFAWGVYPYTCGTTCNPATAY